MVLVSRSPEMPTGLSFDPQQLPMGPKASYRTSGTIDMILFFMNYVDHSPETRETPPPVAMESEGTKQFSD